MAHPPSAPALGLDNHTMTRDSQVGEGSGATRGRRGSTLPHGFLRSDQSGLCAILRP
jgi:hypothetical protein